MSKPNKKSFTTDKKKKAKDPPKEHLPNTPNGFSWSTFSPSRKLLNQSILERYSSPVKTTDISQLEPLPLFSFWKFVNAHLKYTSTRIH